MKEEEVFSELVKSMPEGDGLPVKGEKLVYFEWGKLKPMEKLLLKKKRER